LKNIIWLKNECAEEEDEEEEEDDDDACRCNSDLQFIWFRKTKVGEMRK